MAVFDQRRKQVFEQLPTGSLAIIPGNSESPRNGDANYPFRQNSDFYYLTGFNEPDACAVLLKEQNKQVFILFNRASNPEQERWEGPRAGQAGAIKYFGADQSFPSADFASKLPELLQGSHSLYFPFGRSQVWDQRIIGAVNLLRGKVRSGVQVPESLVNLETIVHAMRLIKEPGEIELMRKAAQISVKAHTAVMENCQPGIFEYQLEAIFVGKCMSEGARFPAYTPIVAAGANACVLHYVQNNAQTKAGDLLLIDAGCEYENYSSDITRTFPVNGKFSAEQRAIYEIVLAAQLKAISLVKPGLPWPALQEEIVKIITQGLIDLKILRGSLDELIEKKAYRSVYMHNSGHWLGLDTHDVGSYKIDETWRLLEKNMVLTVEPGIYISPNTDHIDPKWWGIGVRIEDDVCVTADGHDILSKGLPKTIAELENLL